MKYSKIISLLIVTFLLFANVSALTQNERDDLKNKINELKDDKENFENLLKFLDENFSLRDEPEIVNSLKINAQNLDIDLSKYPNIFVQAQVSKQKNTTALKLILILIILLLIIYLGYLIKKIIKMKKEIKGKK